MATNTNNKPLCPICLQPLEETNHTFKTRCKHEYHFDCLKRWVETNPNLPGPKTCPSCRNQHTGYNFRKFYKYWSRINKNNAEEAVTNGMAAYMAANFPLTANLEDYRAAYPGVWSQIN
jgi:hypothetical protein